MKIAVYAGTFDPITNGHLDIARRASHLFEQVIFAVARSNYKTTLFDDQQRYELAAAAVRGHDNIRVELFSGLLVDFCHQVGATSIIRGLRAVSDFDREFQMALMNRSMDNGVDTVFLMSEAKYMFISSSIIKNTAQAGGNVRELVPEQVYEAMKTKYPLLK